MDQKNLSTVFESGESENQESWYQSGGSTSSLSLNSDEKNDLSPDFLHEDHEIEKTAEVEKTAKIIKSDSIPEIKATKIDLEKIGDFDKSFNVKRPFILRRLLRGNFHNDTEFLISLFMNDLPLQKSIGEALLQGEAIMKQIFIKMKFLVVSLLPIKISFS